MALTDGLVSYWKFDEGSGTTAFDSVGSNDGTANNSRVFGTPGKINNGADFTKGNDIITLSDYNSNWRTTSHSISLWMKASSISAFGEIITSRKHSDEAIRVRNNGIEIAFWVGNNTNYLFKTINTNTFYHIVYVRDKTNGLRLYINNSLEDSNSFTGDANTVDGGNNSIGARFDATQDFFYDGLVDEIAIYNRALSTSEITELWNNGDGIQYPFTQPSLKKGNIFFGFGA